MLSTRNPILNVCRTFSCSSSTSGRHDGRVALLTASTSGIALEAAKRLAAEGAHVVLSSRKKENVDAAIAEMKSKGYSVSGRVCHVSNDEDRRAMIEDTVRDYGGIDYVFSNAAVNPHAKSFLETEDKMFEKIFDVNVKGMFTLVKDCVPHMKNRPNASFILHSSAIAYKPMDYPGAYSVSKTALLGLSAGLMPELAKHKIRINVVAPTSTNTRFGSFIVKTPEIWEPIARMTPYKRPAEISEIAGTISFLFSDDATYVTGETVLLGGAAWLRSN